MRKKFFPHQLKLAIITPLLTQECTEDAVNYRPISIAPVMTKVIEKLKENHITEYLSQNNFRNLTQFGFRKKYSTKDTLV